MPLFTAGPLYPPFVTRDRILQMYDSNLYRSVPYFVLLKAEIAEWLERRTRDRKVPGSSPGKSGAKSFFSRVNFLCRLLFRYPFDTIVTSAARKRSRLFCQKCRWQVTAKHAYTLRMWLCMKWRDMMHGCMVYTERAEMATVSRGTSHVTVKQRCKQYTTSADIQNAL